MHNVSGLDLDGGDGPRRLRYMLWECTRSLRQSASKKAVVVI